MEVAIIAEDMQAVAGSAAAIRVLSGGKIPAWGAALITIADSFVFLFIHYLGVRKLEGFFAFLIAAMAACFFIACAETGPDYKKLVLGALIPRAPAHSAGAAVALIGACITPHNHYLYSALVLTRKINMKSRNAIHEANMYNIIESTIALFVSFVICTAVIATFAELARRTPGPDRARTLHSGAEALEEVFSPATGYIWAVGLLAAGHSATMTGTYAG